MTETTARRVFITVAMFAATHRAIGQGGNALARRTVEIGAIELPESVRHAIVAGYKGYQFVKTFRVDQGPGKPTQFEVHLERAGDLVTLVYAETGELVRKQLKVKPGPPIPSADVAGTWQGISSCLAKYAPCQTDSIIYRITPVTADTNAFDIAMVRGAPAGEPANGALACTLDRRRVVLICIARPGHWEFWVHGDSLAGTLTLDGGLAARQVVAHRAHTAP